MKETILFCAKQIEIILRFVQQVIPYSEERAELENHLSHSIVRLEKYAKEG